MRRICSVLLLGSAIGCTGLPGNSHRPYAEPAPGTQVADFVHQRSLEVADSSEAEAPQATSSYLVQQEQRNLPAPQAPVRMPNPVQPVAHNASSGEGTLTIDGKQYRLELVEDAPTVAFASNSLRPGDFPGRPNSIQHLVSTQAEVVSSAPAIPIADANIMELNLPTALSMVGGQHPAVGFAQWRVQEAYAQLDQANVLWLPSIQAGFSFDRHDGNYQASDGSIVDVNRNSFQYGLGAGATGAGTTPIPGVVARFHLADAIFQPEIAEKTAWARGHAANSAVNDQLLSVAVAYLELLSAYQDARILEEAQQHTKELSKLTTDFAATGQGPQADADRLETELTLAESRFITARERVEVASARLSEELSMRGDQTIAPLDPTVVPIDLVSLDTDKASLIGTGLTNRPELKEAQALVAVACEQFQRQKYAPFVPSVLLGFSTGGFGGGLGNNLDNIDDRYDFDAIMTWEVRNLGFGEGAARREATARFQQAKFEKVRLMDEVAREVTEAHAQVIHRSERIQVTQRAIESAQNSYQRNLSRIRDGQGLPIEVLQSVRALEEARRAYLNAVVDYNESQFRLQRALGWPVTAPASSR